MQEIIPPDSPRARLVALVKRQTELFNVDAPIEDRVNILNQIREVQREIKEVR